MESVRHREFQHQIEAGVFGGFREAVPLQPEHHVDLVERLLQRPHVRDLPAWRPRLAHLHDLGELVPSHGALPMRMSVERVHHGERVSCWLTAPLALRLQLFWRRFRSRMLRADPGAHDVASPSVCVAGAREHATAGRPRGDRALDCRRAGGIYAGCRSPAFRPPNASRSSSNWSALRLGLHDHHPRLDAARSALWSGRSGLPVSGGR